MTIFLIVMFDAVWLEHVALGERRIPKYFGFSEPRFGRIGFQDLLAVHFGTILIIYEAEIWKQVTDFILATVINIFW